MNLRPALTAALDLLADVDALSLHINSNSIGVHIGDPAYRREIADELGADAPVMRYGIIHRSAVVAHDDGEFIVDVHGTASADEYREWFIATTGRVPA